MCMNTRRIFMVSNKQALIVLALAAWMTGCGQKKSAERAPSTTNATRPIESRTLSESDAAMLEAFRPPASEADRSWQEVAKALEPPSYPPEWQITEPSQAEIA